MTNSRARTTFLRDLATAEETTVSTSFEATSLAITLPNRTGRYAIIMWHGSLSHGTNGGTMKVALYDDAAALDPDTAVVKTVQGSDEFNPASVFALVPQDGSVIALYFKVAAGTGKIQFSATDVSSILTAILLP